MGDFLVNQPLIFVFHVVQESTMTHSTSRSKGFLHASILTGQNDESNQRILGDDYPNRQTHRI